MTRRELNRATLARQLLLPRQRRPSARGAASPSTAHDAEPGPGPRDAAVVAVVERVAGLQSQDSRAAAIGLWTRLPGLRRDQLARLLLRRTLVKGTLMRATQHLVSAADYVVLRPTLQPALSRWAAAVLQRRAPGFELADLAATVRPFFDEPRTGGELRRYLHDLYPEADAEGMAIAARVHLPLVQVPTERAPWGVPGNPAFMNADTWLGRPIPLATGREALILRYLAAFGPARLADIQRWSGVAGLRTEVARLKSRLRGLRDEQGRELLDLARAARPPATGAAPPVFLPAWDNTLLAYADRTRVVPGELYEPIYLADRLIGPAALVDGFAVATWTVERESDRAIVVIRSLVPLADEAGEALARTGERLARFVSPDAESFAVRFV